MDNKLSPMEQHYQGSNHHLTFALTETIYSLEPQGFPQQSRHLFFSLAEAMSQLLTEDRLKMIDPEIARNNNSSRYCKLQITDNNDHLIYAELVYNRPGHQTCYDDLGIYLYTELDPDTLRAATGLPFPRNHQMNELNFIQLADYNEKYQEIIPIELFRLLESNFKARLAVSAGQWHELVYKGELLKPGSDASKGIVQFVYHHYFAHSKGALISLILQDARQFDALCFDKEYDSLLHYAYLKDTQGQLHSSINVMAISDSPEGNPTAGVWLHNEHSIKDLEEMTGTDLSRGDQYDPEMPMLLLARYIYDNGLHLIRGDGYQKLVEGLGTDDTDLKSSPFIAILSYQLRDGSEKPALHTLANDYYHYATIDQAIGKLLHAELQLMHPGIIDMGMPNFLAHAGVEGSDGKPLANLRFALEPTPSIFLDFSSEVSVLAPAFYAQVIALLPATNAVAEPGAMLSIPIVTYDTEGVIMEHTSVGIALSQLITSRQPGISHLLDNSLSIPQADKSEECFIRLEWNQATLPNEKVTNRIMQPSLQAGLEFILGIDPQFFYPEQNDPQKQFLLGITLQQESATDPLMKRYYRRADGEVSAAFIIQFNFEHPDCASLIDYAKRNWQLQQQSPDEPHVFLQKNFRPAVKPSTNKRCLPGKEDKPPGPRIS